MNRNNLLLNSALCFYYVGLLPIPLKKSSLDPDHQNTDEYLKEVEKKTGKTIIKGKEPLEDGWSSLNFDNYSIDDVKIKFAYHDGNIGILVGLNNIIVLDFDSMVLYMLFANEHPQIVNNTIVVSTGRGRHIYLKVKNVEDVLSSDFYYNGEKAGQIMGKTKGGTCKQVVAPPSIHITGKSYEYINSPDDYNVLTIDSLEAIGIKRKHDDHHCPNISSINKADNDNNSDDQLPIFKNKTAASNYADKAYHEECKKLRAACEGERNNQLNISVGNIYKLITGGFPFDMDEDEVDESFLSIASTIGLLKHESEATLKSAKEYGKNHPKMCMIDGKLKMNDKIILIQQYLKSKYEFRYNLIKGKLQFKKNDCNNDFVELTDRDENSLIFETMNNLPSVGSFQVSLFEKLINSDFIPEYNFFQDYFSKCHYDGGSYIQQLADTVTVKEGQKKRWELYLRRWLIASVATMLGKGINHTCLVLCSGQGLGKTTWLNRLALDPDYVYSGSINPSDKDSKIMAAEMGLINLDELEGTTRDEWAYIKSLITMQKIDVRRPYGRRSESLKRHASFCASINNLEFLSDNTGARRWLVVEAERIDLQFDSLLVHKAYSEAYDALRKDEKYWFDNSEIVDINTANATYNCSSHEEETLLMLFEPVSKEEYNDLDCIKCTTTDLVNLLQQNYPTIKFSIRKMGTVLRKHLFRITQLKGGTKVYLLKRKSLEDQYAQ